MHLLICIETYKLLCYILKLHVYFYCLLWIEIYGNKIKISKRTNFSSFNFDFDSRPTYKTMKEHWIENLPGRRWFHRSHKFTHPSICLGGSSSMAQSEGWGYIVLLYIILLYNTTIIVSGDFYF